MAPELKTALKLAFDQALELASLYAGATSPNPCVGAAALDRDGKILSVQAHERAGESHAEAKLLRVLKDEGRLAQLDTLAITLEPCNHHGLTPPCTEAILNAGVPIRQVVFGAFDPNPHVKGQGAQKLREAGLNVLGPDELARVLPDVPSRCSELIRTFSFWAKTSLPWVTVKTALNLEGTMIPSPGQKTFTSPESLRLAHELRKRADAILTGSGTILSDQPLFTVRNLADHSDKKRWLAILDRRGRVSETYINQAKTRGFQIYLGKDFQETLRFLGSQGVLEVLVEAGPALTQSVIQSGFWNEHVLIQQEPGAPDRVSVKRRH